MENGRLFLKTPAEKRILLDPTGLLSNTAEPRRLAFRPRKAKEIADHFYFKSSVIDISRYHDAVRYYSFVSKQKWPTP